MIPNVAVKTSAILFSLPISGKIIATLVLCSNLGRVAREAVEMMD
jgi:hypothetical protein